MEVTAIVPTLGRDTLDRALQSLKEQTAVPTIIVKNDDRDTLVKLKEGVNEATTEFIAVADDDAVYPKEWLENLQKTMGPKVGFTGGPCLPLLDDSSSDAERSIAEVTTSFWGTTSMSYRFKKGGKVKDADETNLIGNGLYRKEVFAKILNEEYERIPPAAWETYVLTRIRQLGYRTVFNPSGKFYHRQRTSIFGFARQIFRCGSGRMAFFKQFPMQVLPKFYILFPLLFTIYLIAFFLLAFVNLPITGIPLVLYIAFVLVISYMKKGRPRFLVFYFVVLHLSYGLGMVRGIFGGMEKWT